jgi:nicotinamide-nucleotide amidase
MLETCVVPYLKKLSQFEIRSRNIHIFGLGESAVEARLHTLMESMENPTLAPYAKEGEVMLRLTARARGEDEADALMAPVLERVKSALGDIIYGIDSQSLENSVIELLRAAGKTVAVAESCTGGLIAKRLTDIPGASEVFPGGVTAYSAQAKVSLLGVAPDVLKRYGAVSRETAVAMADGARARFGADVGLAATGIAGPDGDGSGLPPGTVFVALAFEGGAYCRRPGIFRADDRAHTRALSASHAFDMLRRYLTGLPVEVAVF